MPDLVFQGHTNVRVFVELVDDAIDHWKRGSEIKQFVGGVATRLYGRKWLCHLYSNIAWNSRSKCRSKVNETLVLQTGM